jgi:hypothetical protein
VSLVLPDHPNPSGINSQTNKRKPSQKKPVYCHGHLYPISQEPNANEPYLQEKETEEKSREKEKKRKTQGLYNPECQLQKYIIQKRKVKETKRNIKRPL